MTLARTQSHHQRQQMAQRDHTVLGIVHPKVLEFRGVPTQRILVRLVAVLARHVLNGRLAMAQQLHRQTEGQG